MFEQIKDADKITMTQTGLIQGKKGKFIHVSFERKTTEKTDYAELLLPGREILNSQGFDEGELAQLQLYLKAQEKELIAHAKKINHDMIFKL